MPLASCKRCFSPSPNRLHDFDAVAFVQGVLPMPAARHDFTVDLHRDAAIGVAGFGEQGGDGGLRRAFVGLAVEKNTHMRSLTPRDAGRYGSDDSTNRVAAALRRMFPGWRFARFGARRVALRGALCFALLRSVLRLLRPHLLHLHFALLHLLLARALYVLHLHLALLLSLLLLLPLLLLLHLLFACALLVAHLRFALLLELLLAGALLVGLLRAHALLRLFLQLALLLHLLLFLLLADALLGFDVRLLPALSGASIRRLRCARDRPHDGQPSLRGGGWFAGGPDDGRARQGAGFAGVCETGAG